MLVTLLLFAHQAAFSQEVLTTKLLETTTSWDGTPLPHYPATQPKITILKFTVAPGTRVPMHRHTIMNFAVVTKGELTVIKKTGEEKIIRAGEAIAEVINSAHYGVNNSEEVLELIVFYAGDGTSELSTPEKQ